MAAGELVTRCFAARTAAHIAHLRTRSYAAHVALAEFYEGVTGLADSFAEAYQGHLGLITDWPASPLPPITKDTVLVVKELAAWCVEYRDECSQGRTDLQNIVDEVTALCGKTIYKLTNLK